MAYSQDALKGLLKARGGSSELNLVDKAPNVIMIVGVNGGGKTTTIGKLANKFTSSGAKVRESTTFSHFLTTAGARPRLATQGA